MGILYFAIWVILNGKVTMEIVLFGIAVAAAASILSRKVLGFSRKKERTLLQNSGLLFRYAVLLIWEIIKASLLVMGVALRPGDKPEPVVVEFDSDFHTQFQNVLLANSITLTPGTFTLLQEGNHFVVHCLKEEYAEGIEHSAFVQLLEKMKV